MVSSQHANFQGPQRPLEADFSIHLFSIHSPKVPEQSETVVGVLAPKMDFSRIKRYNQTHNSFFFFFNVLCYLMQNWTRINKKTSPSRLELPLQRYKRSKVRKTTYVLFNNSESKGLRGAPPSLREVLLRALSNRTSAESVRLTVQKLAFCRFDCIVLLFHTTLTASLFISWGLSINSP